VYLNVAILPLIALFLLFVGSVASSRLYMKSHDYIELFTGSMIGILSQIILWQFYL
jgi:acid phosphatase family membrane protein YuiD